MAGFGIIGYKFLVSKRRQLSTKKQVHGRQMQCRDYCRSLLRAFFSEQPKAESSLDQRVLLSSSPQSSPGASSKVPKITLLLKWLRLIWTCYIYASSPSLPPSLYVCVRACRERGREKERECAVVLFDQPCQTLDVIVQSELRKPPKDWIGNYFITQCHIKIITWFPIKLDFSLPVVSRRIWKEFSFQSQDLPPSSPRWNQNL